MSPLLLLLFQDPTLPQTALPQTPAQAALDLRQAPLVAETNRIRLTPKIDGRIEEEEWDPLGGSGEVKTFLQWEPGTIHVAASGAAGKDLLLSVDPDGDGWLVGSNNLEARIGVRDGKPFVKLRLLDATNVAGPTYREIPNLEVASSVAVGPDGTIEASIVDPGLGLLPLKDGRFAARIDVIRADEPSLPANEPRALAPLTLSRERAAALSAGLKAKVDFNDIPVVPGDGLAIRFSLSGDALPKRIALRTEGLGREATSASEAPIIPNGKKSVRIEYKTGVQPGASLGYRIARATLTGADGVPSIVQASYRIAPPADVTLNETRLRTSDKDRSLRLGYTIFGNTRRSLSGKVDLSAPQGYRILNGDDTQTLRRFEPRLGLPESFGLFVPANARGTVPIRFSFEIEKKRFEIVRFVTID